jgi:hypothetical protein
MISVIELEINLTNHEGEVMKFWSNLSGLHRTHGPAAIYPNGTRYWYENGVYQPKPPKMEGDPLF